jgi:hypothetical protein
MMSLIIIDKNYTATSTSNFSIFVGKLATLLELDLGGQAPGTTWTNSSALLFGTHLVI